MPEYEISTEFVVEWAIRYDDGETHDFFDEEDARAEFANVQAYLAEGHDEYDGAALVTREVRTTIAATPWTTVP